jgi:phosphatidylglycerol lysyltransferase
MTTPISPNDPRLARKALQLAFEGPAAKELPKTRRAGARLRAFSSNVNWRKIGVFLSVALLLAVWIVLYRILREISWSEVRAATGRANMANALLAFLATAGSYAALVGYDALALRQVGASRISLSFVALTSFIAQAFTFTLGFGLVTGGFVRLRLYQSQALQPSRIIAVGLLCTATFWLGLAAAGGFSLLLAPKYVSLFDGLSTAQNFKIGAAIVASLAGWVGYTGYKVRFVQIGCWDLELPGPKATLLSIVFGLADTAAAALALWLLLPASVGISYPAFVIVFSAATLAGVVSNAPGGIGVFEAIVLLALRGAPEADLLASLLLFRFIYYLVPFAIAAALFGSHEVRHGTRLSARITHIAAIAKPFVPAVTSVSVFIGGFILLVSGTLPALEDRMAVLRRTIPLPFVETSHFLASIIGALLLVVGAGLQQKLRSAWIAGVFLLSAAAIFSLFKGIDYEESMLCFAVIGLLVFGHSEFYRKGGLLEADPSIEWVLAAFIAVGASIWIGAVIYHNAGYENHLWWDFTYRGDEPRFLRATLGIAAVFLIVTCYRLLHKPAAMREPATAEELKRAAPIIAASRRAEANLAYLQDKRLLFNNSGDGFIMYGVRGRTWVAFGDPIAPEGKGVCELVWQFRELVDEHRGIPVFYQATTAHLPVYLDAGFSMAKLGEEAWVDLSKFTLEGKEGRRIRQAKAAAARSEATVEIVPADEIGHLIPDLKRVSDGWLDARGGGEKGFSLGFWSEPYLRRYDHAIVRHFGETIAFANIWKSADKEEYSVDLMRQTPDAPPGVMDLLFITLMESAKAQGFRWFNLGMAPLSGLPDHRLATIWSRFATLIFRYGDRFYNFSGLRSFKNKFKPEWRPRYLAYPGGTFAKVLVDVTALIARSPSRVRQIEETA